MRQRESELTFGPLALALNARALPIARPDRVVRPGGERLAFALDPGGLAPDEERRLTRIPGSSCAPFLPPALTPGEGGELELLYECDRDPLADLAGESEVACILLEAAANLDRPPAEPVLVGIVNVTPDSFSDGGLYLDPDRAIAHGRSLVDDGAAILDVGGESTRPGSEPVSEEEELARVLPVVRGLAGLVPISIDTQKAGVAAAALEAGAEIVNDVSAGTADPGMIPLVAERGVSYVIMHRRGSAATMQVDPRYGDPVAEVSAYLRERVQGCLKAGIEAPRIVVDPGIGFGKRLEDNLEILRRLPELYSLGLPLLLGVSRKSFIGHITGSEEQKDFRAVGRRDRPADRTGGSAAAVAACVRGGAEYLRVHDVRVMSEAARVARALYHPAAVPPPCSS